MSRTKPARIALIGLILIASATLTGLISSVGVSADGPESTLATCNGFLLENVPPFNTIYGGTVHVFDDSGDITTKTTMEDGYYEFNLSQGHYIFLYEADGWLTQMSNVLVTAESYPSTTFDDIWLDPINTGSGFLNLTVEDGNGDPVANTTVEVQALDQTQATFFGDDLGFPDLTEVTDANGSVSFGGLATGDYRAMADNDSYYIATQDFHVTDGANTTDYFNLTERNANNAFRVQVRDDDDNVIAKADVYMYQVDVPARAGEKGKKVGGSSYFFEPEPGTYLITASADGYNTGIRLVNVTGPRALPLEIVLPDFDATTQTNDIDFADWDSLTWTITTGHVYDDGRNIDDLDVGFTGLLLFDIDRIWGDNDGNVTQAEMDDYIAWEQAFDVNKVTTETGEIGQLIVGDVDEPTGYEYDPDSYSFQLNYPLGGAPTGKPVTSTDMFTVTTEATYISTHDDLDEYTAKLWVANSNPGTYEYTYDLEWPDDFETTDNKTGSKAEATITGTPDSQVVTGASDHDGGVVNFTVAYNTLPSPVIEILTDLNTVEFLDGDELVDLWVVNSLTQVNLSAEDSTDTMEITNYRWLFSGSSVTNREGELVNITFDANPDHNATVTLTLEDAHGENGTTITIYVDDTAPTAAFNMTVKHAAGEEGEPYAETNGSSNLNETPGNDVMVFNAGDSNDSFLGQNSIIDYDWNITGDDFNFENDGPELSLAFAEPGDYTVKLTVTDAAGNVDFTTQTFMVNDIDPPTPAYSWCSYNETGDCVAETGFVGRPYEFNANLTEDNSGTVASYKWEVSKSEEDVENIVTIEQLLFTLDSATYTQHLGDNIEIPQALKTAFGDNDVTLSGNAAIALMNNEFAGLMNETHWQITDGDVNYTLKDNGTDVDIYTNTPGDDAMLVYITFFEHREEGYTVILTVEDEEENDAQYTRNIIPAKPDLPDLFSTNIRQDPLNPKEDSKITFEVDIVLIGPEVEGDFHVSFYIDEVGGQEIANETIVAADINDAEEKTITLTVTWNKARDGDHTLIVFVDSGSNIYEGPIDEKVETSNQEYYQFFVKEEKDPGTNWKLIIGILVVLAIVAFAGYYFLGRGPYMDDE